MIRWYGFIEWFMEAWFHIIVVFFIFVCYLMLVATNIMLAYHYFHEPVVWLLIPVLLIKLSFGGYVIYAVYEFIRNGEW